MMRQTLFAVILEIPKEIAVPVEFLQAAANRRTFEALVAISGLGSPEQVAVLEQVSHDAGILTRPGVNDAAFVVVEVSGLAAGIDEIVAGKHPRVVQQHAELFALGRGCGGVLLRGAWRRV